MTDYIYDIIKEIENSINRKTSLNIIVMESECGMGKTYAAKRYCDQIQHAIYIDYFPFVNPLEMLYKKLSAILNTVNSNCAPAMFRETLLKTLVQYCDNTASPTIIFDDIDEYGPEMIFFLLEFFQFAISKTNANSIIFILIYNRRPIHREFLMYSQYIQYINIPDWSASSLKQLFFETYPNAKISCRDLDILINYSFHNAQELLSIVDYLKSINCFKHSQGGWICEAVSDNIVLSNLKESIEKRYNLLPSDLRVTIQKAAIIGHSFEVDTLQTPLKVMEAHSLLVEIERLSKLIQRVGAVPFYEFKTRKVRLSIKSYISMENYTMWNDLLGAYYCSLLQKYPKSIFDVLNLLEKISYYYEESGNSETAIAFYMQQIPLLIRIEHYREAIGVLELLLKKSSDNRIKRKAYYYLYVCNSRISDYKTSLRFHLLYVSSQYNTDFSIMFDRAEALYNAGKVTAAYEILSKQYEMIGINESNDNPLAVAKTISLLASVEETLGLDIYIHHFNEALDYSKKNKLTKIYYELLRKSNMAHSGAPAIALIRESVKYYSGQSGSEYAKALHNLGTASLIWGESAEAADLLLKSHCIFEKAGNNGIIYTQNSLAIYEALYNQNYQKALEYIYHIYAADDSFCSCAINFNISTLLRKLNRHDEGLRYIKDIDEQGSIFPYFAAYINIQKAYYNLDGGNIHDSYNHFKTFLDSGYCDYTETVNSVSIKMQEISAGYDFIKEYPPHEKLNYLNALSKIMTEHNLIFCDLYFWE